MSTQILTANRARLPAAARGTSDNGSPMTRVLYVYSRKTAFTAIDRAALGERFEVVEYYQPGLGVRPLELVAKLRRVDVVFGWHASWHTFAALTLASMMRKPSVLVVGGFDTARLPEIGYGAQRPGARRWFTRRTIARANRLVTNSEHSRHEIEANLGLGPERVALVYHGIPDRFGDPRSAAEPERMALSVGVVYGLNLERKGQRPFTQAAAHLPDVQFALVGKWLDGAIDELRAVAGPNVTFTGYLDDETLDSYFRRAAVYVQPSRHEGFGVSVAEAMLARCVPVVTDAGALLEVVGDTGVVVAEPKPLQVAEGIRRALEMGPEAGERARRRVLERFPYEMRRDGICREVEAALDAKRP
jgi:glycosyltransferase involved in cell wall biosynthesis